MHDDSQALKGRELANRIIAEVSQATAELTAAGWAAKLVSVTVGDTSAARRFWLRT